MADFYEILGVGRDAGTDEIKRAFRKLARETHPDANPDDPQAEARFRQIAEAYEVLSDPDRRARYDRGESDFTGAGFGSMEDILRSVFGDGGIFGDGGLFGAPPGRGSRSRRGRDIRMSVDVELEDAAFGTTRDVAFRAAVECDTCGATGAAEGTHPETCGVCNGVGQVRVARRSLIGNVMSIEACSNCAGIGDIISDPCPTCRGTGAIDGTRDVTVEIPPGVADGTRLRLNGHGEFGGRGAGAGDLYVDISTNPHEHFQRDGDNLIHRLGVGVAQAALGTTVAVPLIDGGHKDLSISPGTQPGSRMKIPGEGTGRLGRRGRGDLIVIVDVAVPTSLSNEQADVLRAYAEAVGEEVDPPKRGWLRK